MFANCSVFCDVREVRSSVLAKNSRTFVGSKKTHFLVKKLTKTSNAFGKFFWGGQNWTPAEWFKIFRPNFLFSLYSIPLSSPKFFLFALFWFFQFYWKVRCSFLPVRSSVSKFGHHVRSVRSSVCQCSRCSKFGILMFVPPLVWSKVEVWVTCWGKKKNFFWNLERPYIFYHR